TEHFRGSGLKVFAGMIEKDPKVRVWAIPAKGGGSRAFCDRMNAWAQEEGQPGLGYIMWRREEIPAQFCNDMKHPLRTLQRRQFSNPSAGVHNIPAKEYIAGAGPIAKNIGEDRAEALREALGLWDGDAAFFVAGDPARFYKFAGLAR